MPVTPVKLQIGQTKTFRAVITPSKAADGVLTWSLTNPALGTVTPKPPLEARVTAVQAGSSNLQVHYEDTCSNNNAFYPIITCNPVESVEITNCPEFLGEGETYSMLYQLTPSTGLCDNRVSWSTSDTSILTVLPNGVVTAVGREDQEATITVTTVDGNWKDDCTIKIIFPIKPINDPSILPVQDTWKRLASGTQPLAAITRNSRNVYIELDDLGMGDSIAVFTRDGTLIAGRNPFEFSPAIPPALPIERIPPMTKENGFLPGATLKRTGPLVFPPIVNYNATAPYNTATWKGANLQYSGCGNRVDDSAGDLAGSTVDQKISSYEYFRIDWAPEHLLVFITGNGAFNVKATWDEIKEYPYD